MKIPDYIPEHGDILKQLEREARRNLARMGGTASKALQTPSERVEAARKAVKARWARSEIQRRAEREVRAEKLAKARAQREAQKTKLKKD